MPGERRQIAVFSRVEATGQCVWQRLPALRRRLAVREEEVEYNIDDKDEVNKSIDAEEGPRMALDEADLPRGRRGSACLRGAMWRRDGAG